MNLIKTPMDTFEFLAMSVSVIFAFISILAFFGLILTYILHKMRRSKLRKNELPQESGKFYTNVESGLGKIIGGVTILLFALATGNGYIQFASLFIGGLLIASERFLVHLAGIFKSKSDKVADVVNSYGVESLSTEEIRLKVSQEIEEANEQDPCEATDEGGSNSAEKLAKGDSRLMMPIDTSKQEDRPVFLRELYKKAEDLIFSEVRSRLYYREHLQKFIKLKISPTQSVTPDAVVLRRDTNEVVSVIEVKLFNSKRGIKWATRIADSFATLFKDVNFKAVIFIVMTDYDFDKVNQLLEMRKRLKVKYPNFGVVIYQLESSSISTKLELINNEDFQLVTDDPLVGW